MMNCLSLEKIWKLGLSFSVKDKNGGEDISFSGFLEECLEDGEGEIAFSAGTALPTNRYIIYAQAVKNFPLEKGFILSCDVGDFLLLDARAFYFGAHLCHYECVAVKIEKGES